MTTAKQKKGDTSNEVKRGTFLTRLDTALRLGLTYLSLRANIRDTEAPPLLIQMILGEIVAIAQQSVVGVQPAQAKRADRLRGDSCGDISGGLLAPYVKYGMSDEIAAITRRYDDLTAASC
jgi:hypothetical protein